jgi:hypothetical protein
MFKKLSKIKIQKRVLEKLVFGLQIKMSFILPNDNLIVFYLEMSLKKK